MRLRRRTVPFELKALKNRTFEGYGSVFGNVDLGDDIVMPGAFMRSLATRTPKFLYQHSPGRVPGVFESVKEDSHGLHVVGRFIDTTLGNDAYIEMKEGAIDGLSIGFETIKAEMQNSGPRKLVELKLWEVSMVTFPMNESAVVDAVKHFLGKSPGSIRDFEETLRDEGGMSQREAKTVISQLAALFKHDDDPSGMLAGLQRDAEDVDEAAAELVKISERFATSMLSEAFRR